MSNYRVQNVELNRTALANAFSHEYGHALFETNLLSLKLGLTVKKAELRKIDTIIAEQHKLLKKLVATGKATKDTVQEEK